MSASRALDYASLAGMALGVALMLQPWFEAGFRAGFFVTLACTLVQIVASHLSVTNRGTGFQPLRKPSDAG